MKRPAGFWVLSNRCLAERKLLIAVSSHCDDSASLTDIWNHFLKIREWSMVWIMEECVLMKDNQIPRKNVSASQGRKVILRARKSIELPSDTGLAKDGGGGF